MKRRGRMRAPIVFIFLTLLGMSNGERKVEDHDETFHEDILGIGSMGLGLDPEHHHLLSGHHEQGKCEPIKIGMCLGVGYNETTMPNLVSHDVQADADAMLQTFTPLIQYGCSMNLKLFLCTAHVPMCTDKVPEPIGPCRSLCESVRLRCEPVMKEFGFEWPQNLNCSKFHPENKHEQMCIDGPEEEPIRHRPLMPPQIPSSNHVPLPEVHPHGHRPVNEQTLHQIFSKGYGLDPHQIPGAVLHPSHPAFDPLPPRHKEPVLRGGKIGVSEVEGKCHRRWIFTKNRCWLKCGDSEESLYLQSEKGFARSYALLWAILSLSSSVIALLLSLCSLKSSAAERPILYLALCQVMYSIGVIVGSTTSTCVYDKSTGLDLLPAGGHIPSVCALVFLITYFFWSAAIFWWVILCLSWLLSQYPSLASSLQQREWSMFHLSSWGIASLITSIALVHKKVDADELTGICGVGFQDVEALKLYNLVPLSVSLILGVFFVSLGLIQRLVSRQPIFSRCKSTSSGDPGCMSHGNNGYAPVLLHSSTILNSMSPSSRLKALESSRLWMRVEIFALVHSLPIACQIGTLIYELAGREAWESGADRPNLQIFLLRLNMNLIAGLTTGVWVLSTFSFRSFTSLAKRVCCCFWFCCQSEVKPHLNSAHLVNPVPRNPRVSVNSRGFPQPPLPPRNPNPPPTMQQIRTDAWRRGETIV